MGGCAKLVLFTFRKGCIFLGERGMNPNKKHPKTINAPNGDMFRLTWKIVRYKALGHNSTIYNYS